MVEETDVDHKIYDCVASLTCVSTSLVTNYAVYLHEFILHMKQCVQMPEKAELIGVAAKPLYRVC